MVEDPIDEITLNDSVSECSETEQAVDVENHESPSLQTGLISVPSTENSVGVFRKKCQERRLREDELKRAIDTYRSLLLMNAEHQSYLIAIDSVKDLLAQNYPSVVHLVGFIAGIHGYVEKWKTAANKCHKILVEFSSFISGLELNDINKALRDLETCQTKLKEATITFQNATVAEEQKQTELKESLMDKIAAVNAQIDTNRSAKEKVTKHIREIGELEESNAKLKETVISKRIRYQELESSICRIKEDDEEILLNTAEKGKELKMKHEDLADRKIKMDVIAKKRQEREDHLNLIRDEYKQRLEVVKKEYSEVIQQNLSKITVEGATATERQHEEESLSIELRKLTKELDEKKLLKDKLMAQKEKFTAEVVEIKRKNALLLARQVEETAKKEEERKAAEALAEKKRIQKEKRLAKKKEKEAQTSQPAAVAQLKSPENHEPEPLSNPLEESFFESQGSDSDFEALAKMKRRGRKKTSQKTPKVVEEKPPLTRPKRQSAQTAMQRTKSYLAENGSDDDIDALVTSLIVSSNDNPLASSTDEATSSPKKSIELAQAVDVKPQISTKTPEKPNKAEVNENKTPKKLPTIERPTASQIIKNMNTPVKKTGQSADTPRPNNILKNSINASRKPLANTIKIPDPIDADTTNQSFWDF